MNSIRLAFRLLLRDLRAGELHILGFALLIAVASLTSVGFFADRLSQALNREANQLLGGDLLMTADHPWDPRFAERARALGLRVISTTSFTSMASTGEVAQLAGIKAVEPGYPLRGQLRVAPGLNQPDAVANGIPAPGTVWLDERLSSALQVKSGDTVGLGETRLTVAGVITYEGDRGVNFFAIVPRLMMNAADLPATRLIRTGSRVSYRLQFAGEPPQVESFRKWAQPRLARGESLEDINNARPEVRAALDRAQKFLRLAALLAVVLAAVAIGLSARRFMQRHLDGCAVMRCLGATQRDITLLYLAEFLMLGAVAIALGCVLGFAVQFGLARVLAALIGGDLPAPTWLPVAHGFAVGLTLLAGFVVPQLLRLGRVSTLRVLRREWAGAEGLTITGYAVGLGALAGLMFWIAGEAKLGLAVVGGFTVALGAFAAAARLAIEAVGRVRGASGAGWRYGLASVRRRLGASLIQVVGLSVGLTALLLLTLIRNDLLAEWQRAAPPDAPNRFIINAQPEQVQPIEAFFAEQGVESPALSPMIRGRLTARNGKPVEPEQYEDDRARRLVEREFNLSYSAQMPPGNRVVAGAWYGTGRTPQFSVEEGLAKTLGLELGDMLTFAVAGTPVDARITSLRKLDWDSMRVNFFVIAPPGVLDAYPTSFITAFHLPDERADFTNQLVARFPNLTVIDMSAIMRQFRSVMDQISTAVQFVFGFALLAGVVVMLAALDSTHAERGFEMAVLRTLGARNRQLRSALLAEFAALGTAAGALAGIAASAIGWVIAHQVFSLDYLPSLLPVLVAAPIGAVCVMVVGWFGTRRVLRQPPLESIRALA
ncbi:MAG: FtsX-like permease family protein [Sterolibacteriaceae bacterium]|nr:FtsX-like permease family protein [Sterolibacteriaceae bacterium]